MFPRHTKQIRTISRFFDPTTHLTSDPDLGPELGDDGCLTSRGSSPMTSPGRPPLVRLCLFVGLVALVLLGGHGCGDDDPKKPPPQEDFGAVILELHVVAPVP